MKRNPSPEIFLSKISFTSFTAIEGSAQVLLLRKAFQSHYV